MIETFKPLRKQKRRLRAQPAFKIAGYRSYFVFTGNACSV